MRTSIVIELPSFVVLVLSAWYALASKDHPTWPKNIQHCMTAVRWLRKNADRLQIDIDRIGSIGGSAGGHLSAMLGLLEGIGTLRMARVRILSK